MKAHNVTSVLLMGPQDSHKSSFLLQGAVHFAMQGHTVIYITAKEFDSFPLPLQGLTRPTPDVLSLIKFLYLPCWQDLLHHIFSLHIHALIPSVLVVEALDDYWIVLDHSNALHQSSEASHAALICAALFDGAAVCAKRLKSQARLIISLNKELPQNNFSPLIDIFFTDVVWMFQKEKSDDEERNSDEYSMTNVEAIGSQVRHYKIFFKHELKDGPIVLSKVSFWETFHKIPP